MVSREDGRGKIKGFHTAGTKARWLCHLWLRCRGGEAGHVRGLARALEQHLRQERQCVWAQL